MKINLTNNEDLQVNGNINNVPKTVNILALADSKLDTLVSGTNIKTVNSNSILGSGDLHFDGSNLVYSGDEIQELVAGETIDENLDRLDVLVHGKQDTLVSGTNIKTVNNNSLLGSGNVEVGDITGEELETEIEELESTLLTDALRKSEQVLLPAEKTQVLTNLGIADVVTQGNLKTVNSASLVGTGNIEIVSTNVGDVTIEQGIGDSQTTVMSQKAVTDEVRKVVAADLAGTSTWIREQLTNAGWIFGKYLTGSGTATTSTAQPYAITHIIPVDYNVRNHVLVFKYNNNKNTSSYINWYENGTRKGYINGLNSNIQQSTTILNTSAYDALNGLRFTVNADDIPNCSIYDSTSKKYIWEGAKYLYDFIKDFSINVPWATLLNNVIAQELGTFSQKAVSQKVITEQFDAHDYIDKRYTYMNGALCGFALDDYPNIDVREAEGISLVMDGENVAVSYNAPLLVISNTGSISSTNPMFLIHRYWSSPYVGFMIGWTSPVSGQGTSFPTNKTYNKWAHQVITFDFNTGESNIYVNGVLWATATVANFDKNAFRTALRAQTHMYLSAPTSIAQPTKITGLAVFPRAITASEVTKLFGAGGDETKGSLIPTLYNAYDMLAHPFTTWNINLHTQTADVTTNENGGKNLTLISGQTYMQFGFTGLSSKTSFYHSIDFDFTVVNGSCKFNLVQYNNNTFTSPCTITDSNGDVVDFANTTLTSGNTYHMRCVPTLPYNPSSYGALTVGFRFNNMTEGTVLWIHESVVIRERGAALKLLIDNFRGTYWELYNGYQIPIRTSAAYSSNTAFAAYYDPFKQNTVIYNSSVSPQFNGQMAVDAVNNRVYVGILNVNGGTWKQINNS